MMGVPAFWRAFGVRAGIRGGVDGEPQPGPPRARLPRLRRLLCGYLGQGLVRQPVVDLVVLRDPGAGRAIIDELRQRASEQLGGGLLVDLPGSERVIQRPVATAELRDQRQLHQRGHRVISSQDRIGQLELRVRPRGQAGIQPGAELPQRQEPVNGTGDLGRIRGCRRQQREPLPAGQRRENMVVQRLLPWPGLLAETRHKQGPLPVQQFRAIHNCELIVCIHGAAGHAGGRPHQQPPACASLAKSRRSTGCSHRCRYRCLSRPRGTSCCSARPGTARC